MDRTELVLLAEAAPERFSGRLVQRLDESPPPSDQALVLVTRRSAELMDPAVLRSWLGNNRPAVVLVQGPGGGCKLDATVARQRVSLHPVEHVPVLSGGRDRHRPFVRIPAEPETWLRRELFCSPWVSAALRCVPSLEAPTSAAEWARRMRCSRQTLHDRVKDEAGAHLRDVARAYVGFQASMGVLVGFSIASIARNVGYANGPNFHRTLRRLRAQVTRSRPRTDSGPSAALVRVERAESLGMEHDP